MSVELYRESPGKFDSRTLNRKTLNRWTGRKIIPAKIPWLELSRELPVDRRIPAVKIEILLESNPLNSRIIVQYGDWPYSVAEEGATMRRVVMRRGMPCYVIRHGVRLCVMWHEAVQHVYVIRCDATTRRFALIMTPHVASHQVTTYHKAASYKTSAVVWTYHIIMPGCDTNAHLHMYTCTGTQCTCMQYAAIKKASSALRLLERLHRQRRQVLGRRRADFRAARMRTPWGDALWDSRRAFGLRRHGKWARSRARAWAWSCFYCYVIVYHLCVSVRLIVCSEGPIRDCGKAWLGVIAHYTYIYIYIYILCVYTYNIIYIYIYTLAQYTNSNIHI